MNPALTYTIIDLPELLALQYVYLGSLEGEDMIHSVISDDAELAPGRINLVSFERALSRKADIQADSFLSTWALTECPGHVQDQVWEANFFGATSGLLAARIDANNKLRHRVNLSSWTVSEVPELNDEHEYWAI
jgi:hypothetical protein